MHKQVLLIYKAFELLDYKGSGLTHVKIAEIIITHLYKNMILKTNCKYRT